MSNSVVPAAAAAQAKHLVKNKKLTKQTEDQKPAQDEQVKADHEPEAANAVQTEEARQHSSSMSDISLSGDFSFAGALAEAAEGSASLAAETEAAQGDDGYSSDDSGGGISSTVLLVGAVGLVGAGIAVAASGGGGGNEAPTVDAASQNVTTAEDTAKQVTVGATDPDGDPLTYSVSTNPAHGTVTGGSGGTFTYTPAANYNGADSFVVTVSDGEGGTVTQTVNVTVTPVADPVTGDPALAVSVDEDAVLTDDLTIVDPDGDAVTYAVTTAAAHGTVAVAADGSFTYTPAANFNGADSFVVTGSSGDGSTFAQTVNVTVNPVNDAPVQGPQTTTELEVEQDGSAQFLIDFDDPDGDQLTADVSVAPQNGTIDEQTNTYTPNAGFVGDDSFEITVTDGVESVSYTVSVSVVEDLVNEVSVDGNIQGQVDVFDADAGDFVFTDSVSSRTDAFIENFGEGDVIEVTGADASDYNFGTSPSDSDDLRITFNDGANFTQIILDEVLAGTQGFVFDYDSAVDVLGYNFMDFA